MTYFSCMRIWQITTLPVRAVKLQRSWRSWLTAMPICSIRACCVALAEMADSLPIRVIYICLCTSLHVSCLPMYDRISCRRIWQMPTLPVRAGKPQRSWLIALPICIIVLRHAAVAFSLFFALTLASSPSSSCYHRIRTSARVQDDSAFYVDAWERFPWLILLVRRGSLRLLRLQPWFPACCAGACGSNVSW